MSLQNKQEQRRVQVAFISVEKLKIGAFAQFQFVLFNFSQRQLGNS